MYIYYCSQCILLVFIAQEGDSASGTVQNVLRVMPCIVDCQRKTRHNEGGSPACGGEERAMTTF